eukprot:180841-Rhodomonas_salina.1
MPSEVRKLLAQVAQGEEARSALEAEAKGLADAKAAKEAEAKGLEDAFVTAIVDIESALNEDAEGGKGGKSGKGWLGGKGKGKDSDGREKEEVLTAAQGMPEAVRELKKGLALEREGKAALEAQAQSLDAAKAAVEEQAAGLE